MEIWISSLIPCMNLWARICVAVGTHVLFLNKKKNSSLNLQPIIFSLNVNKYMTIQIYFAKHFVKSGRLHQRREAAKGSLKLETRNQPQPRSCVTKWRALMLVMRVRSPQTRERFITLGVNNVVTHVNCTWFVMISVSYFSQFYFWMNPIQQNKKVAQHWGVHVVFPLPKFSYSNLNIIYC